MNVHHVFRYRCRITSIVCIVSMLLNTGLRAGEIHDAAAAGDLNRVRALLETDPTLLGARDADGATPLHHSCLSRPHSFARSIGVAEYLLDRGADVNARTDYGFTPLHFASSGRAPDSDLILRLIARGADVNAALDRGLTSLHWVASSGDLRAARLLIDHGADLNACDTVCYGTVLQMAINSCSSEEMAMLLVERGAKVNQRFSYGNTELHLAALRGRAQLTWLMVDRGADVHAVNEYGRTALDYAARHGYRSVADVLIAAGATPSAIVERDYGKAPQLSAPLAEGEACLWYLGGLYGGGYAVKTSNHLLIFDEMEVDDSPESALANGNLNPSELSKQMITVFITKILGEQYQRRPLELAKRMPGITCVVDASPGFTSAEGGGIPPFRVAARDEDFVVDGVRVHAIAAAGRGYGGAVGVGYLVEADELRIFHAGFHASDGQTSQMEKYRLAIDRLKSHAPIDIAIVPVSGHLGVAYEPFLHLIDVLEPKAIYLMGGDAATEEYPKCAAVLRARAVPVSYPEGGIAAGERFHYSRDSATAPRRLNADVPSRADAYLGQPQPGATPQVTATGVPASDYRIQWSRIADYPVRLSELSAIAVQGRIHVIGGKITKDNQDPADNCDVNFAYAYDPASDTWTRRTGMPTARYDVGLAELAGQIFAISSHNESYEPTSDAWRQHPPLEHGGAHLGVAAGENEIFVFGFEGPERCSQSWAFNPNTNAWRERAPIPTPRMFPVVTALGGRIFVMGGLGHDGKGHLGPVRNAVEVYHPATDRWEKKRPMPDAVFGAVGAGVFDGRIFLVGVMKGENLANTRLTADVYTYAPDTDAWSRVPDSMPHNHGGAGVAFLDGRVYVIGGHDDAFKQYSHAYVGEIELAGTESRSSAVGNERLPVVPCDQGVAYVQQVLKTLAAADRP